MQDALLFHSEGDIKIWLTCRRNYTLSMDRLRLQTGQDFLKPRIIRPVTASKSRACREGHTSGPCQWLFSAARPVGDVKSLKALHCYNVVKAPAVGVITVWQYPAAFLEEHTSGPCPSLFLAARVRSEFSADT